MNPVSHLSERMPLVASGAARWSPADAQHLDNCDECRAEWTLVQAAARLGRDVELSLDMPAVEAGVLVGLRAAPARPRRVRPAFWLIPVGIAALLAIAVLRQPSTAPVSMEASASLLPELETLTSTQLEAVMTMLPAAELPAGPDGFEDLSESEVSSVLKDLEG